MINLPDFKKAFEYENNFYLTCDIRRIKKILAHYELFKMVFEIPGAIIECGVFKGLSLIRFAVFQDLAGNPFSKKIIGFDTFGNFPEINFQPDEKIKKFIEEAGDLSISKDQLINILRHKEIDKYVELIEGDITETVPAYLNSHPDLKISLLNLDVDIYEPTVTILEYFYPEIERGGLLLLDDYGVFPGETKAIDDYFKGMNIQIHKLPFRLTPSYIIKE